MIYYFDSSALVKRYIQENGSEYINQIISDLDNALFTAEITLAEVAAVIAAKHRAPGGIADLYFLVATERAIIDYAVQLSQQYRLRGYDAVQLATALSVQQVLQDADLNLIFVASDQDLLQAAQAKGLAIADPLQHP
jgi:uncharacterized protein